MKSILRHPAFPEAYLWLLGIVFLAFIDPHAQGWTVCPLNNLGFAYCPGCGLGRSVALLLQGKFQESFHMHPMGGIALGVLLFRSLSLFINNNKLKLRNHYGQSN